MDPKVFLCVCVFVLENRILVAFKWHWNTRLLVEHNGAKVLVEDMLTAPILGGSSQLVSSLQLWLVSPLTGVIPLLDGLSVWQMGVTTY